MNRKITHLKVFDEVIHKRLQPWRTRFSKCINTFELIRYAQETKIKTLKPGEDADIDFELSDFSWLGYHSNTDYEFEERINNRSKTKEIYIVPTETYIDALDIVIPEVDSVKVNCFFMLIVDEYARIRTRADLVIDFNLSDEEIRRYALSILQRSRKLLYEAKHQIIAMKKKGDHDSFRIFFFLADILIRNVDFFQKHFKEYLRDHEPADRRELFESLYDCATDNKTTEIINREIYSDKLQKRSYTNSTGVSEPSPSEYIASKEKTFLQNPKDLQDHSKINTSRKITLQWNGQVNQLVDVFEQLRSTETPEKSMVLEVLEEDLRDFLLQNFINKLGKPLSFHTLNTLVKPYRTDKRLKENSPRKIDISDNFS